MIPPQATAKPYKTNQGSKGLSLSQWDVATFVFLFQLNLAASYKVCAMSKKGGLKHQPKTNWSQVFWGTPSNQPSEATTWRIIPWLGRKWSKTHGDRFRPHKDQVNLPRTQMTSVLIGKGLVMGGWPSKIGVIWVIGSYKVAWFFPPWHLTTKPEVGMIWPNFSPHDFRRSMKTWPVSGANSGSSAASPSEAQMGFGFFFCPTFFG